MKQIYLLFVLLLCVLSAEEYEAELSENMIAAVKGGDKAQLCSLLDNGESIEARDEENGQTALILAALEDKSDIISALLERNADVEARDYEGFTALMLASYKGNLDSVNILLSKEANVDAVNDANQTAIMLASMKKKVDVVKRLLEARADPNIEDDEGLSLRQYANAVKSTDVGSEHSDSVSDEAPGGDGSNEELTNLLFPPVSANGGNAGFIFVLIGCLLLILGLVLFYFKKSNHPNVREDFHEDVRGVSEELEKDKNGEEYEKMEV